ncbi:MAG: hypothetical protein WBQ89_21300 [Candidatus Acidiferrum sp.]
MSLLAPFAAFFLVVFFFVAPGLGQEVEEHTHPNAMSEEGLARAAQALGDDATARERYEEF